MCIPFHGECGSTVGCPAWGPVERGRTGKRGTVLLARHRAGITQHLRGVRTPPFCAEKGARNGQRFSGSIRRVSPSTLPMLASYHKHTRRASARARGKGEGAAGSRLNEAGKQRRERRTGDPNRQNNGALVDCLSVSRFRYRWSQSHTRVLLPLGQHLQRLFMLMATELVPLAASVHHFTFQLRQHLTLVGQTHP